MIEAAAQPARRVDAGLQQVDLEAELAEQRRERAVQLVAEAPATAQGDLFGERDLVELDGHAEMDVEVLERHALDVRPVEQRERVRGGQRPAVGTQARQIRSGQIGAHGPPGYAASVPRTSAPKR